MPEEDIKVAIEQLKNPDVDVRYAAIGKLTSDNSTAAYSLAGDGEGSNLLIAALTEALEDEHEHIDVRLRAATAIIKLGNLHTAYIFLDKLENIGQDKATADNYELGYHYSLIIGRLGTEAMVSTLLGLTEYPNPVIKASAIWALGPLGDKGLLPQLLAWKEDENDEVAANAGQAVSQICRRYRVRPTGEPWVSRLASE